MSASSLARALARLFILVFFASSFSVTSPGPTLAAGPTTTCSPIGDNAFNFCQNYEDGANIWHPGGHTPGRIAGNISQPYCAVGRMPWRLPRTTTYPQPSKDGLDPASWDNGTSIAAEFNDVFFESNQRAYEAWVNSSINLSAFYWNKAMYDIAAMFTMVSTDGSGNGVVRIATSQADQAQDFWSRDKTSRDGYEAGLVGRSENIFRTGEDWSWIELTGGGSANVAAVLGSREHPLTLGHDGGIPIGRALLGDINANLRSMSSNAPGLLGLLSRQSGSFQYDLGYVRDAAMASPLRVDGIAYPVEIMVDLPDDDSGFQPYTFVEIDDHTGWRIVDDEASPFPAGTQWYVRAIFSNRRPRFSNYDEYANAFYQAVRAELTRVWQPNGTHNYYYYPAFMAPSAPVSAAQASAICGDNDFSLTMGGYNVMNFPAPAYNWYACKTVDILTTAQYEAQVTNPSSCWLYWRKAKLLPPKLDQTSWSAVTNSSGAIYAVTFDNTRLYTTLIGQPARVTSLNSIPTGRNGVLPSAQNNLRIAIDWNVTHVGLSASVGSDASGSPLLDASGNRASTLWIPRPLSPSGFYNLSLAFDRTAASRLQDAICLQQRSAADLQRVCGIVYNEQRREWLYAVTITTWWDGVYQPAGYDFRGLFSPEFVNFPPGVSYSPTCGSTRICPLHAGFPTEPIPSTVPSTGEDWPPFGPTSPPDQYGTPMYYATPVQTIEVRVIQLQPEGH